MYFRKTNKKRSERGSPTGKEGYTENPPGRVGISPGGYKRGMFQDQNCIWDTIYDQPLNKPPKMERKIGL